MRLVGIVEAAGAAARRTGRQAWSAATHAGAAAANGVQRAAVALKGAVRRGARATASAATSVRDSVETWARPRVEAVATARRRAMFLRLAKAQDGGRLRGHLAAAALHGVAALAAAGLVFAAPSAARAALGVPEDAALAIGLFAAAALLRALARYAADVQLARADARVACAYLRRLHDAVASERPPFAPPFFGADGRRALDDAMRSADGARAALEAAVLVTARDAALLAFLLIAALAHAPLVALAALVIGLPAAAYAASAIRRLSANAAEDDEIAAAPRRRIEETLDALRSPDGGGLEDALRRRESRAAFDYRDRLDRLALARAVGPTLRDAGPALLAALALLVGAQALDVGAAAALLAAGLLAVEPARRLPMTLARLARGLDAAARRPELYLQDEADASAPAAPSPNAPTSDTPSSDTPSTDTPSTDTPSTDTPTPAAPKSVTPSSVTPNAVTPSFAARKPRAASVTLVGVEADAIGDAALHAFDLEAPAATTTALFGPSGSGGRAALAVIAGHASLRTGRVMLGDRDAATMSAQERRGWIDMLHPAPFLFDGAIRENIRAAAPDAPERLVREAVDAAELHTFLSALPGGLDFRVGPGGAHLSAQSRRLIAIARVILRRAPILLIDEAISEEAGAGSEILRRAAARAGEKRTVIVAARRLATLRAADMVVVLEEGRAVERGRHDDLIKKRGRYARLHALKQAHEASPA